MHAARMSSAQVALVGVCEPRSSCQLKPLPLTIAAWAASMLRDQLPLTSSRSCFERPAHGKLRSHLCPTKRIGAQLSVSRGVPTLTGSAVGAGAARADRPSLFARSDAVIPLVVNIAPVVVDEEALQAQEMVW